jgi:CRP/FNR family transcriptional regulator
MTRDAEIDSFFRSHPDLAVAGGDLAEFRSAAAVKSFTAGSVLVSRGAECRYLPFVLRGSVKVHRIAENGREIILYHIREGESCILSALGIVNRTPFPALAEIETGGDILLVTATILEKLIDRYPAWRRYVFSMYNERLGDVLELVDEMLFRKIDVRLARLILERADESGCVRDMTHHDLAIELGSSREVVSRVLKSLEDRGMLDYSRNRIEVIDVTRLKNIAEL